MWHQTTGVKQPWGLRRVSCFTCVATSPSWLNGVLISGVRPVLSSLMNKYIHTNGLHRPDNKELPHTNNNSLPRVSDDPYRPPYIPCIRTSSIPYSASGRASPATVPQSTSVLVPACQVDWQAITFSTQHLHRPLLETHYSSQSFFVGLPNIVAHIFYQFTRLSHFLFH